MWKRLPYNLKLMISYILISLGLLQAYRIAFYAIYSYRAGESPWTDVLWAFVLGIRFDISTVCIILGPFVLLSLIHYLNRFSLYRILWVYLPPIILFFQVILLVADIIYFENGNKHIGYEAYAFLGPELFVILGAALESAPFTVIGGLLLTAGFVAGVIFVLKKIPYEHRDLTWKSPVLGFFLALVFLVIGI